MKDSRMLVVAHFSVEDGGNAEPHALVSLDKSSAHQPKEYKKFIPKLRSLRDNNLSPFSPAHIHTTLPDQLMNIENDEFLKIAHKCIPMPHRINSNAIYEPPKRHAYAASTHLTYPIPPPFNKTKIDIWI